MVSARAILRGAFDPLLPDACAICALPGSALCPACDARLEPIVPPLCSRCGHPWAVATDACPACATGVGGARAAVVYDDRARRAVAALKDRGRVRVGPALARIVVEHVPRPGCDALVPVPLGRRRQAERGYNQSELIARELGRLWGLPVVASLRRTRSGPAQRGLSRASRRQALRGAFSVRRAPPARACLVDDVHTTGTTLAACTSALKAAGAESVGAVTVARVLLDRPTGRV